MPVLVKERFATTAPHARDLLACPTPKELWINQVPEIVLLANS